MYIYGFLKNWKNWKQTTEQIFICPRSQQRYSQKPKGRNNPSVHWQMNNTWCIRTWNITQPSKSKVPPPATTRSAERSLSWNDKGCRIPLTRGASVARFRDRTWNGVSTWAGEGAGACVFMKFWSRTVLGAAWQCGCGPCRRIVPLQVVKMAKFRWCVLLQWKKLRCDHTKHSTSHFLWPLAHVHVAVWDTGCGVLQGTDHQSLSR